MHRRRDAVLRAWEDSGATKVCLRVEDEASLLALQATAREVGVASHVVVDAGRTQARDREWECLGGLGPAGGALMGGWWPQAAYCDTCAPVPWRLTEKYPVPHFSPQVAPDTRTVLALLTDGPLADAVTGSLKLL